MDDIIRDLIEYDIEPKSIPSDIQCFKILSLEEKICIPPLRPDIRQITKVRVKARTKGGRAIKTVKSISLDGRKSTGWKFALQVEFNTRIEYLSNEQDHSVLAFSNYSTVNTYIMLWEYYRNNMRVIDGIFVEDVYAEIINDRTILLSISSIVMIESA